MSQPKKKTSPSRRNNRRYSARWKVAKPAVVTCKSCNEPTRPHRVCGCGAYNGKTVLETSAKA